MAIWYPNEKQTVGHFCTSIIGWIRMQIKKGFYSIFCIAWWFLTFFSNLARFWFQYSFQSLPISIFLSFMLSANVICKFTRFSWFQMALWKLCWNPMNITASRFFCYSAHWSVQFTMKLLRYSCLPAKFRKHNGLKYVPIFRIGHVGWRVSNSGYKITLILSSKWI